ncbi:unnamed protein product [Caenorhabditis angaria]|uniref:Uncharacterized protein n=1 Tax=Caenorhabditis angaria TaxID=860376 RepID=A0A9P1I4G8_9PELO|nr:unnamed protein product [Caenorhabditis angaria]
MEISNYFHKFGFIDQSYTCYCTHLSNFTEAIIVLPEFEFALNEIKEFYSKIREDSGFCKDLSDYFEFKHVILEIPKTDYANWKELLDFLKRCSVNHKLVLEFVRSGFSPVTYIGQIMFNLLTRLQNFLNFIQESINKLAEPTSFVSEIIPEILKIKQLIYVQFPEVNIRKYICIEFEKHLRSDTSKNEQYEIATFLDPRFAFDEKIFSKKRWLEISRNLKETILNCETIQQNMTFPLKKMNLDVELLHYISTITQKRCEIDPFEWWKGNSNFLSILYASSNLLSTPPPFSIDAEKYFGKNGKLMKNNETMTLDRFNYSLCVVSDLEEFRGRGFVEQKNIRLEKVYFHEYDPEIEPRNQAAKIEKKPVHISFLEPKIIDNFMEKSVIKTEVTEKNHRNLMCDEVIKIEPIEPTEMVIVVKDEKDETSKKVAIKLPRQQTAMERVLGRKITIKDRNNQMLRDWCKFVTTCALRCGDSDKEVIKVMNSIFENILEFLSEEAEEIEYKFIDSTTRNVAIEFFFNFVEKSLTQIREAFGFVKDFCVKPPNFDQILESLMYKCVEITEMVSRVLQLFVQFKLMQERITEIMTSYFSTIELSVLLLQGQTRIWGREMKNWKSVDILANLIKSKLTPLLSLVDDHIGFTKGKEEMKKKLSQKSRYQKSRRDEKLYVRFTQQRESVQHMILVLCKMLKDDRFDLQIKNNSLGYREYRINMDVIRSKVGAPPINNDDTTTTTSRKRRHQSDNEESDNDDEELEEQETEMNENEEGEEEEEARNDSGAANANMMLNEVKEEDITDEVMERSTSPVF